MTKADAIQLISAGIILLAFSGFALAVYRLGSMVRDLRESIDILIDITLEEHDPDGGARTQPPQVIPFRGKIS